MLYIQKLTFSVARSGKWWSLIANFSCRKTAARRRNGSELSCLFENFHNFYSIFIKRKRRQLRELCEHHRQRIKELSTPRRIFRESSPEKCAGKPLKELIPRLSQLSRPRWCTPKYVRPKSEEFCLPGVITDWEAWVLLKFIAKQNFQLFLHSSNEKWASKRAQPKKDFSKLMEKLRAKKCQKTTITCEGMQRIERLAKPRSRYMRCKAKPSSRNYHSRCLDLPTERILELSEPKPRVEQNNDFRPLSDVLKVSELAKAYEGENITILPIF